MALAYNGGKGSAHAALSNLSSGTIKIESGHGSGRETAGISVLAQGAGASAEITNGVSGVMTIKGDADNGGYGIGYLALLGGVGSIVNNGTLTMDRNAIYAFSDGRSQGHFSNTGTVNTEAELMFESSQSLVKGELPIQLLKPAGDTWTQAEEKLSSYASSYEATIWKMKEDWAENSTWEGGTLNFTNIDSDSTDAAYLKNAFTSVMGDGVEILFKGEALGDAELPTGTVPKFSASHANELIALGYAGAVVTNVDLDLSDAYGNPTVLTVGSDASSQIRDSFGFRKLRGVWSLDVKDGKYFVLAGDASGGSLIEGDGAVTVSGSGTLKLGVESDSQSARGSLSTVSLSNGSLEANNGSFTVSSLRGKGTVRVKERASLDIRDAELSGSIRNEGTLTAQTLKVSKGTLLNSGTLRADGKVTIEATAKLAVDGRLVADSLDVKGVVVKGKRADIVVGAASQTLAAEAAGVSLLSVDAEEDAVHKFGIREPIGADEVDRKDAEPAGERDAASSSHSPASAQAFAAFDAANRIAADIESGTEPDRHGLWVKLQTNDGRFDAVRGSRAFELETDGALLGAETQLTSSAKVGAAFAYLDGDIKFNRLNFSWSGYALNFYGAYRADAFALKATAGWLRGTTEAEKDLDADVWHAGLHAEYGVPAGAMTVTPFMGARILSGSFDDLDSQTVFSIPMGAKLSGTIEAGGWTLTPALEAAYVRSMGDTEAEDVRFLPKDTLRGSIGLKAGKGMWTGELSYVGATGSNGYRSNSFNVKLGLLF